MLKELRRSHILFSATPAVVAFALIFAHLSTSSAASWRGQADIAFQATSTLHDFSGTVQADPFALDLALDGSTATLSVTAAVAVAQMDTRHAKRDENMRKMFDAARFPLVVGALDSARIDTMKKSPVPVRLTIRARTTSIPATIQDWRMENGKIVFTLGMTLSLRDVGLSPPVILGFIRVGDAVPVRVRVELEPETL